MVHIASAGLPRIIGWRGPVSPWERFKIGGGTPPILTQHGWLIVYHGVSQMPELSNYRQQLCYSAGVMVLATEDPREIRYRSAQPVLAPVLPQDRHGTIASVVFPTGIDRRTDIGAADRFDVYYGMADSRIGVARLDVPDRLPAGGVAEAPHQQRSFTPDEGCQRHQPMGRSVVGRANSPHAPPDQRSPCRTG